jgi:hypothetical protein
MTMNTMQFSSPSQTPRTSTVSTGRIWRKANRLSLDSIASMQRIMVLRTMKKPRTPSMRNTPTSPPATTRPRKPAANSHNSMVICATGSTMSHSQARRNWETRASDSRRKSARHTESVTARGGREGLGLAIRIAG